MLQAPPGAGKTTRVPLALLAEPWLGRRRIVLLEPRRIAARAAASRMAANHGSALGDTVGYRIRREVRSGPRTRIEVVTEGILTRLIQRDPALEGIGLVIFDEFHERSLHADLGLALVLQAQAILREDLRILVMSATLDGAAIAATLRNRPNGSEPAPVITSEGRSFPVETHYLARPHQGGIEEITAAAVRRALAEEDGDLLVFLPGAGEIRRCAERLSDLSAGATEVLALYGDLPQAEQDRVLRPSPHGRRRVVLSTSIAETSLTIDGIGVVIDSGLMRVPRFSPRTGLSRLATVRVTGDSADQRRGRAGRLGPGACYRLWTAGEQAALVPRRSPEILSADLAALALELTLWGGLDGLRWLDPPPPAALAQAFELLDSLGATQGGTITPHGRQIAELALHPRLASMLLRARERGQGALACDLAALLSERDPFRRGQDAPVPDLRLRIEALRQDRPDPRADPGALRRLRAEAGHWRRRLGIRDASADADDTGWVLALAYPDRIAQRREGSSDRYLLRNGRGVVLPGAGALSGERYLVASDLDDSGRESRIFLAAAIGENELREIFRDEIERVEEVRWDAAAEAVVARWQERLGAIVLREGPMRDADPDAAAAAITAAVVGSGLEMLPWGDESRRLAARVAFLRTLDPSWPDLSPGTLGRTAAEWLEPHLRGLRRREELRRLDLAALLRGIVGWERMREMDELAPSHLELPTGTRAVIDYDDPANPSVAVKLQEMFGQVRTPTIARGRVALTLHLLSPARRPVQVTRDLESFWREGYFEVRKDLRGRYPKHPWPDDPLRASPTRRTKGW